MWAWKRRTYAKINIFSLRINDLYIIENKNIPNYIVRMQNNIENIHIAGKRWSVILILSSCLNQFLIAIITSYYKLGGLKTTNLLSSVLQVSSVQSGSHWAKIKVSAIPHSFWRLWGRLFSCLFHLLETTRITWLVSPSSVLKPSSDQTNLRLYHLALNPLPCCCDYFGPTEIIWSNLPLQGP